MKLQHLQEARYAKPKAPSGWPAEKVVKTFFVLEEEWTKEMNDYPEDFYLHGAEAYIVPSETGLIVFDKNPIFGNRITTMYKMKDGTYLVQDSENEREWEVNPSEFVVRETRDIYNGSK